MKVRVLGAHNLEGGGARHTCFLVDDHMAIDAGSLVTSLSPGELVNIRAVLLTHRHFDHVRDLPSLGLATLDSDGTIPLYGLPNTLDTISTRLMDGVLYPDFTKSLSERPPKYSLQTVTSMQTFTVSDYAVRPIWVPHAAPAVGYIVHQAEGRSTAYCGDTGGGLLPFFEDPFKPDPIFVEVTFGHRMEDRAKLTGHLTARLLQGELEKARGQNLTIPRIMIVHRSPDLDQEITEELQDVAAELGVEITLAHEGQTVEV